jgi:hypothetical protein
MKKKTIISSLILLGCVVSMHAQVVKSTQGSNGAGGPITPPSGTVGLYVGSGTPSIGANATLTNLNVGIGTNTPSETLEVNGSMRANSIKASSFTTTGLIQGGSISSAGSIQGTSITSTGLLQAGSISSTGDFTANKVFFTNSQPNGSVYADFKDRNKKCSVINAGTLKDLSDNSRVFWFLDFPQSNLDPKSKSVFGIDDRSNKTRFSFWGEEGGATTLNVFNKRQEVLMRVFEDGNDAVFMDLPKTNSRVVIGAYGDYLPGHKFVVTGSAKIEGNILTDSNVGIGTANFADGSDTYRLSVKGKIRAEEVRVYTTWADYVFMKDYKLPNLREVETYIKENGHLKNVPSAEEVTEKGLQLGDMAKIQQEKIEELTLYLIQQNKEIEELKVQVKALLNKK